MSEDNKFFFHDSDTGTTKEHININTLGDGVISRDVTKEGHDGELIRKAIKNGYKIITTTTICATTAEIETMKNEEPDFEKEHVTINNPHGLTDEEIIIDYFHLNKGMKRKFIAKKMGYGLSWVKNRIGYSHDKCLVTNATQFKVIWLKEYGDVTIEYVNFLINGLINKPKGGKK